MCRIFWDTLLKQVFDWFCVCNQQCWYIRRELVVDVRSETEQRLWSYDLMALYKYAYYYIYILLLLWEQWNHTRIERCYDTSGDSSSCDDNTASSVFQSTRTTLDRKATALPHHFHVSTASQGVLVLCRPVSSNAIFWVCLCSSVTVLLGYIKGCEQAPKTSNYINIHCCHILRAICGRVARLPGQQNHITQ